MPRVLKIDSMTNRPICKSAGAGGFLGSSVQKLCHVKARIGASNQCFRCRLPVLGIDKTVGCLGKTGYACGPSLARNELRIAAVNFEPTAPGIYSLLVSVVGGSAPYTVSVVKAGTTTHFATSPKTQEGKGAGDFNFGPASAAGGGLVGTWVVKVVGKLGATAFYRKTFI